MMFIYLWTSGSVARNQGCQMINVSLGNCGPGLPDNLATDLFTVGCVVFFLVLYYYRPYIAKSGSRTYQIRISSFFR
jgi:hypothetical protein